MGPFWIIIRSGQREGAVKPPRVLQLHLRRWLATLSHQVQFCYSVLLQTWVFTHADLQLLFLMSGIHNASLRAHLSVDCPFCLLLLPAPTLAPALPLRVTPQLAQVLVHVLFPPPLDFSTGLLCLSNCLVRALHIFWTFVNIPLSAVRFTIVLTYSNLSIF